MRYVDEEPPQRQRVSVPGRDDVGEVVDGGRNIGDIYCVAVYFPETGEVAYYEKTRVQTATS
ncbi:MAG TPA: hypothetical protein VJ846_08650 [Sphingomicrobium sp.]|nr:hypothetical protein [Sphingomicrobium sp.]